MLTIDRSIKCDKYNVQTFALFLAISFKKLVLTLFSLQVVREVVQEKQELKGSNESMDHEILMQRTKFDQPFGRKLQGKSTEIVVQNSCCKAENCSFRISFLGTVLRRNSCILPAAPMQKGPANLEYKMLYFNKSQRTGQKC